MNDMFLQFLYFLQTTSGTQIFYDKTENTFIKKVGEKYVYLHSDSDSQILEISDSQIISLNELATIGDLPDFYRTFTGKLPENKRKITGKLPEPDQHDNETNSEIYRKISGNVPVVLKKLPASENSEINKIAEQIEKITIEVLKHTDKKKTIDETFERYKHADKLITKKNLTELYKLYNRIKLTRSKQASPAKSELTIKRLKRIKRNVIVASAVCVLFTSIIIFIKTKNSTPAFELIENSQQLTILLNDVVTEKDTIITDWRKEYILKKIALPLSEAEAKKEIELLIIYK